VKELVMSKYRNKQKRDISHISGTREIISDVQNTLKKYFENAK